MPDLPEIRVIDGPIKPRGKAKYRLVFDALDKTNGGQHIRLEYDSVDDAKTAYNSLYQYATRHGLRDRVVIRMSGTVLFLANSQE